MKKQKWTEKPITWGGYSKLCAICTIISMICSLWYYATLVQPTWWVNFKSFITSGFSQKAIKE